MPRGKARREAGRKVTAASLFDGLSTSASYDELLANVKGRIERFHRTRDVDVLFEVEAEPEAMALLGTITDPYGQLDAAHEVAWLYCFRARHRPGQRTVLGEHPVSDDPDDELRIPPLTEADLALGLFANVFQVSPCDVAPEVVRHLSFSYPTNTGGGISALPKPGAPKHWRDDLKRSHRQALTWLEIARGRHATELVDPTVIVLEALFARVPAKDPERPRLLASLGAALHLRYIHERKVEDLLGAVTAGERAIKEGSQADTAYPSFHGHLGTSLLERYKALEDAKDRTAAIKALTYAVDNTPHDDPRHAQYQAALHAAQRTH